MRRPSCSLGPLKNVFLPAARCWESGASALGIEEKCHRGMGPLLEAGHTTGLSCRFSNVAEHPARFPWPALLFAALSTFLVAFLVLKTPASPASELSIINASAGQTGAIADLDGDGRPELAILKAVGWGPDGVRYRIEVTPPTGVSPRSINFSAKEAGLGIFPRNLDNDGDLDLIISSPWSRALVAVLINDGRGGLTPADPAAYSGSILVEGPGISADFEQESLQATPGSFRSCIDLSVKPHFSKVSLFERLPSALAANPQKIAVSQPHTRAPPCSCYQELL